MKVHLYYAIHVTARVYIYYISSTPVIKYAINTSLLYIYIHICNVIGFVTTQLYYTYVTTHTCIYYTYRYMYVLGYVATHLIYTYTHVIDYVTSSQIYACVTECNYMYIYTIHVMIDTCVSKKFFSHNIPIQ